MQLISLGSDSDAHGKRVKTVQLKNAFLNSSVFSQLLKVPGEIDCLENNVKLFQTDGAA